MIKVKMIKIRQRFSATKVVDVAETVTQELQRLSLGDTLKPGHSVAVTAGSRGISNIGLILRKVVDHLKTLGAQPFIVPAMGSHGGATAQGQLKLLAHYGITEASMGVPIKSSMDVVKIATSPLGLHIYIDKYASEANHIVLVNRVKPHTRFSGKIESGIAKMLLVGLGKHQGASLYHKAVLEYPFDEIAFNVVPTALKKLSVLCGLAIVENAHGEIAWLKALCPEEFLEEEPKLLRRAYELMAKLPLETIDLLVIDEMGKDISGTGMDTTVIGRKDSSPIKIKRIFVGDLTEASNGNACAIGLADFTTRRLVDKINLKDTYINCITGLRPEGAKIPIAYDTDREAIEQALNTLGLVDPQEAKIVRIKNTNELETLQVSESCMPQLEDRKDIDIISGPEDWAFDKMGNFLPLDT
ncbi:MAG: DUF2088 domain-containing protein [Planctomycetes bacterium]|uniref:lactate racemase domain-containing protein n=1 Tax=Candidatus Tripitaka californicus TaxID=3367616 RepID=UPI004024C9ED|nr:DUF2088 domain-containing protein [Planctomycetota bacterium]